MTYREKYFTYVLVAIIPGALLVSGFSGGPIAGFLLAIGFGSLLVVAGANLAIAIIQDLNKK